MILVADSGSTKTAWCLIDKSCHRTVFESIGMNPYNITSEQLVTEMKTVVMPHLDGNAVGQLYFYGSGCSADSKKQFIAETLQLFFPQAQIEVEHDLLAACRALCGNEAGIASILGTGSNSCLFDGNGILENVPSLGYVLCDEGAGSQIGKFLLTGYLRHEFPAALQEKFREQFPQSESEFLDALYKKSLPNRFLASFTPFAAAHKTNPYIQSLLERAFDSFFENQIKKYTRYQAYAVGIVGSIGFHFEDAIRQTAAKHSIRIGKIIRNPLDELVKYHCPGRE